MNKVNKNQAKWINEYIKSATKFLTDIDQRTFEPFSCWAFHPIFRDLWLKRLYQLVLQTEKISFNKVVKACPNPSSIRAIIFFIMFQYFNLVKLKLQPDKIMIREIFNFFVKILKQQMKEDIFAYKINIGHSVKEVKDFENKIKWQSGTSEISSQLGKLYLALSSLVNGLMNDWCTDNNFEVWGPYQLKNNSILVIREFTNLKPVELWAHAKNYKYKKIKIYTIYKNVDLWINFVGCHTIYKGDLSKGLVRYAVEVDGKFIKQESQIKKLVSYYLELAEKQYQKARSLNFEQTKQKVLEQEHYQLRNLFKLVGEDWNPHSDIKKIVKNKKLMKSFYPTTAQGLSKKELNKEFGLENLKKLYS